MASTTIAMPRPSQVGGRLGKMRVSHTRGRRGVAGMQPALHDLTAKLTAKWAD